MTEVFVVETIKALPGKAQKLAQALQDIVPVSKKGPGCLQYDVFRSHESSDDFLVIMRYNTIEDLRTHENSDYIRQFVSKFDGILYGEVKVSVWTKL